MLHLTAAVLLAVTTQQRTEVTPDARGKARDETSLTADLQKLQGTWELTRRVDGRTIKSVKIIDGNKTKLTRSENDRVFWAHTSEFTLSVSGPVRVFTFFDLRVTAGPDAGRSSNKRSSFLYKVSDKTLTEVTGMLQGETGEPRLTVWKRVGSPRAKDKAPTGRPK